MGNVESSKRNNGFDWYSTADQVARDISLSGKNVIVTGANTGIGKESARVLAKMGANVFLGCRSASRGKEALADLQAAIPQGKFTLMELDLGSLKSIKKFVQEFNNFDLPLHVLLNNAGVMACVYAETEDGFEMQLGTNHLGHFYLTNLLLPRLKQAATPTSAARVVNVSSSAHRFGDINFADLKGKNTWNNSFVGRWKAYGQSKTANILFSYELNERMKAEGANIISVALHPGSIVTELSRHIPGAPAGGRFVSSLVTLFKTIPQGAATSVYCCSAPELEKSSSNWIYFSDSNEAVPLAYALNPENAKKLWELSEQLTGLTVSH